MKQIIFAVALAVGTVSAFALEVSNVSARQRWPWNGLVDVDFTLSGAESSATWYRVGVVASWQGVAGKGVAAKTFVTDPVVCGDGQHRLVWNMEADYPGVLTSNLTVSVTAAPFGELEPVYLVIDLSAGPEATSYSTRYSFSGPDLSSDVCRTTELWLKRVPAGTFTEGKGSGSNVALPAHAVKLTKPFYMAIFETTQKQWERVMGNWPSFFANETYRDARPVETVVWSDIRGGYGGWYDGATGSPTAASFIGKMRARAGLAKLDLPSEAQWEYTCRAGTTGDFYYNGTQADATKYARTCGWNDSGKSTDSQQDLTKGTAKVGTYPANPWGFYDFYGNVTEVVPDANNETNWSGFTYDEVTVDPKASSKSNVGMTFAGTEKGSGNNDQAGQVNSYKRQYRAAGSDGSKNRGFRICVNAE